jgi:hypothetical protein
MRMHGSDEARAVQVEVQRTLGQVAQHVQLGQGGSGVLQRRQLADQVFQQRFVEHFPGQGAALGRQRLVFEGFQLRGDEALGAFERLAADVVAGADSACLLGSSMK